MGMINHLKKNTSSAFKAGVGYTIGNFFLKGITFLTIPIFSRLLSTHDYGIVNIFISYDAILSLVLGLGLHASVKNAKYEMNDLDEYCSTMISFIIRNFIFILILANISYPLYQDFLSFDRIIVNLLLVQSFSSALILMYNNRVALDYRYQSFLKVSIFNTLFNIGLSLVFIFTILSDTRYLARILGSSIAAFMSAMYIIYTFYKMKRPTKNKTYIKFGLKFSLPLIPHGLSTILLSQFDRIMIQKMSGYSQAGIYSFCTNISLIPTVIFNSLDQVWMTWFFEKMSENKFDAIKKKANHMITMFGMIICFFTAFSPEMIKLLAPKSYWDSVYCVIPVVLSVFFVFLYSFPSYVEYFYKKTKLIALGSMMAAAVNVLLNYIFIKRYGYIAAAYTTLFAYFMYFLYHWIISRKLLNVKLYDGNYFAFMIFFIVFQTMLQVICVNTLLMRFIIFIIAFTVLGLLFLRQRKEKL